MICAVIMAGGKGERFWPKSRANSPKQFTDLTGTGSMLALTYRRMTKLVEPGNIFVVTGSEYAEITRQTLPELPPQNVIIEPEGRNTAPCIGLAAITLERRFPDATMVVVPADHLIKDDEKFVDVLRTAVELARSTGGLVTLGLQPTRAETGYGYLKTGAEVPTGTARPAYKVQQFVEKPDAERAGQFLAAGNYLWNGGIFVWQISAILAAFKNHLPEAYDTLDRIKSCLGTDEYPEVLSGLYSTLPKVSIDYAIMEKAPEVYTVPGDFYWDDIGTWHALERIFEADRNGNVLLGNVIAVGTKNTIVDAGRRLVAVVGAENLVIVDTEDITFICDKSQTDAVRELLNQLRSQKLERYL